jgi:phytanoyl-CoA hydroxylase
MSTSESQSSPAGLTTDQINSFHQNGYLILSQELSAATVTSLLAESHNLLTSFPLETHPLTKFTTGDSNGQDAHVGDDYFLSSGDKVRFFFEEAAFSSTGSLLKPKEQAINKIGHYLHELSAPFKGITTNARNAAIAHDLGFKDPRCLQSMVICKQPEIGGAVPPHQDSTFLFTEPPSAVGWWYALEDATLENGCLSFAPGSHKWAPISSRFVRKDAGVGFTPNEGSQFPPDLGNEAQKGGEVEYTMGPVKAGDLVLIHGNILHKSEMNASKKSRFIYTFHVIEGENKYDGRNWLQPPEKGFSRLN